MKQRSLMPLFSNRNYFPLTRQVSAHANQHKIFLMSWKQWQSWNFLYFASTISKTGQTFQSFWGQWRRTGGWRGGGGWGVHPYCSRFIAAELRNVGFKHKFCRRWGVFQQNHLRYSGCLKFIKMSFLHIPLKRTHFTTTIMVTTHRYRKW